MSKESVTRTPPFIQKLREMLNDPKSSHGIQWCPGDNAFCIDNVSIFTQSVLPKYFKHNNLSSFVRQLNIYGFNRVKGSENFSYSHPDFTKTLEDDQIAIKRKDNAKGSEKKQEINNLFEYEALKEEQKLLKARCRELSINNIALKEQNDKLKIEVETMMSMKEKLLKEKKFENGKELSYNSASSDYTQHQLKNHPSSFNFCNKNKEAEIEKGYQFLLGGTSTQNSKKN